MVQEILNLKTQIKNNLPILLITDEETIPLFSINKTSSTKLLLPQTTFIAHLPVLIISLDIESN